MTTVSISDPDEHGKTYYEIDSGEGTTKKISTNWVFDTTNNGLIPSVVDSNCFRKIIKPTDFIADNDHYQTVTTFTEDIKNRTSSYQRLNVFSYADLQFPASVTEHQDSSTDGSHNTMTWNAGSKATGNYEGTLTYSLYGGVSTFTNDSNILVANEKIDTPEIYCFIDLPYGYELKRSYIYIGDMRKDPGSEDIKFDGIKMKTKILEVGGPNVNVTNKKGKTPGMTETQREFHTNNIITYEDNGDELKNTETDFNKVIVLGLKYEGPEGTPPTEEVDGKSKEATYHSNFAVIKGGWVEFKKI